MSKKQEEIKFSSVFVSHINREEGYDYIAIPNANEDSHDRDVDVYAKSKTFDALNLQIKIIDRNYISESISRAKEAESSPEGTSGVQIRDLDPIKWAKQTITECSVKYAPSVRKSMVLLLCIYHGTEINQEYAKTEFREYQEFDFKGIYLVNPSLGNGNCECREQITTIKQLTV